VSTALLTISPIVAEKKRERRSSLPFNPPVLSYGGYRKEASACRDEKEAEPPSQTSMTIQKPSVAGVEGKMPIS